MVVAGLTEYFLARNIRKTFKLNDNVPNLACSALQIEYFHNKVCSNRLTALGMIAINLELFLDSNRCAKTRTLPGVVLL